MSQRKRGKVPMYWWDFCINDSYITVETDDPRIKSGVVAKFPFDNKPSAEKAITAAESLVEDLKAGRTTAQEQAND